MAVKNVQTATQETEENIYLPKTADRTVQQGEQLENTFEVRDFNLFYGNFHALKNINLDILKQHVTAFIGPSGCGNRRFYAVLTG